MNKKIIKNSLLALLLCTSFESLCAGAEQADAANKLLKASRKPFKCSFEGVELDERLNLEFELYKNE